MNKRSFENLLPGIRTKAQKQSLDHTVAKFWPYFATKRSKFAQSSAHIAHGFYPRMVFHRQAVTFQSHSEDALSFALSLCPLECWTVDGSGKNVDPGNGSPIRFDDFRNQILKSGWCFESVVHSLIHLRKYYFLPVIYCFISYILLHILLFSYYILRKKGQ